MPRPSRKGDLRQAAAAARMELRLERHNVGNSLVVALEQGDHRTAEQLRKRIFEWSFTARGQGFPARLTRYRQGYRALKDGRQAEAIEKFKEALRQPPLIWKNADVDLPEVITARQRSGR